jgi:hypothetical protein
LPSLTDRANPLAGGTYIIKAQQKNLLVEALQHSKIKSKSAENAKVFTDIPLQMGN